MQTKTISRHLIFCTLGLLCSIGLTSKLRAQSPDQIEYVMRLPVRASEANGVMVTVVDTEKKPIAGINVVVMPDPRDPRAIAWMEKWKENSISSKTEGTSKAMQEAAKRTLWETYFRELVLRYKTNTKGVVTVRDKGDVRAMRKGGSSRAMALLGKPVELVWAKTITIRVQAVNAQGKPVRGLSLSLRQPDNRIIYSRQGWSTDKQGFASLALSRNTLREKRLAVSALMLTRDPVAFVFDPRKPEMIPDPIRLEIPAYGKVRVYLRNPKGDLVAKLSHARLRFDRAKGMMIHHTLPIMDPAKLDGDNATFDFIGVGMPVSVSLWTKESSDSFTVRSEGPSFPHEMVVLTCEGVKASPKVVVRVHGLDQSVLVQEKVFVVFSRPGSYSFEGMTTDKDGRLEIMVKKTNRRCRMHIVRRGQSESDGAVTEYLGSFRTKSLDLTKQTTLDLGDIQLTKAPILAAGVVVDSLGKPIEGVSVRCGDMFYALPDEGGMSASGGGNMRHHLITGPDGRFEFLENGETPPKLSLTVTKGGYALRTPPCLVDGGQANLRIALDTAATVEGAFAPFPIGVEKWPGQIKLWSAELKYSRKIRSFRARTKNLRFSFPNVPTGDYHFGVFAPGQRSPAIVIEGIRVAADGTVSHEALKAIDWTPVGTFCQVEFVNPEGEAFDRDLSVLQYWSTRKGSYSGRGIGKNKAGRYVAILPPGDAWIDAHHPRYQTVEVRLPITKQRFVMKPRPKVTIEITNFPKLVKLKLQTQIRPTGNQPPHVRLMNRRSFRFFSDKKVEVYVKGAGKFEFTLQVNLPAGNNSHRLKRLQTFEFEIKEGETKAQFKFELEQGAIEQLKEWEESADKD